MDFSATTTQQSIMEEPKQEIIISEYTSDNIVDWSGPDDPTHPINWPLHVKLRVTAGSCSIVFTISFASSVFAPAVSAVAQQYGVSQVVMSLGVGLFIAGFAIGPLIFAPLSEVIGHLIPLMFGIVGCSIFQLPLALANNVPTILISRFLAGALGSACLAVGSGMFTEVYEPISRGIAVGLSAMMINLGSVIGPIVGSYATESLGWRWTGWITLILSTTVGIYEVLALRETSTRIILIRRAKKLRKQTGNLQLVAKGAERAAFSELRTRYLTRPAKMFWYEPILIILTIYLTFIYGTLYLAYQMFPLAFKLRGWSTKTSSLPFISVALGVITAWLLYTLFLLTWYKTRRAKRGAVPEDRLPPMIIGAVILPFSLAWFGWTLHLHWISQVFACFFIGLAVILIFISGIVYIVDVYTAIANSALSIHVVIRSIVAASFPLWSTPMYEALHIQWSATVLAAFSALLMPFPVLFMIYGPRIRKNSRYAVVQW